MPSRVTYMNQSAPFWDFIASMEQQGSNNPFFSQNYDGENHHEHEHDEGHHPPPPPFGPWGWGQFFGGRGMPHRGPPPPGPPPHEHEGHAGEKDGEQNDDNGDNDNDNSGEGPSGESGSDNEGCTRGGGHHSHCGGRRGRHGPPGGRGGFGPHHGPPHGRGPRCGPGSHHGPGPRHGPPRGPPPHGAGPHHGPPHHGPGPHHGPPHHGPPRHGHGGRGPRGPWGRHGGPFGGGFGGGFDPSALVAQFWDQFVNPNSSSTPAPTTSDSADTDFSPEADVFDTESSYVIHVSLPGAKKEDVGVNWDAEKSELAIAGVIYRPGDEDLLKTLAMNERKVGPFERKVRLGTRAIPAQVDVEGITAKLEDGILRVEVPKLGETGFVEIKKVDIE